MKMRFIAVFILSISIVNNDMGFADRFSLRNAKIELGSPETTTYHPSERKGGELGNSVERSILHKYDD